MFFSRVARLQSQSNFVVIRNGPALGNNAIFFDVPSRITSSPAGSLKSLELVSCRKINAIESYLVGTITLARKHPLELWMSYVPKTLKHSDLLKNLSNKNASSRSMSSDSSTTPRAPLDRLENRQLDDNRRRKFQTFHSRASRAELLSCNFKKSAADASQTRQGQRERETYIISAS